MASLASFIIHSKAEGQKTSSLSHGVVNGLMMCPLLLSLACALVQPQGKVEVIRPTPVTFTIETPAPLPTPKPLEDARPRTTEFTVTTLHDEIPPPSPTPVSSPAPTELTFDSDLIDPFPPESATILPLQDIITDTSVVTSPVISAVMVTESVPLSLPTEVFINGVSRQGQSRNLSCESRAAASLAGYYGVSIEEMEFFEALPKTDNPATGFVGDVDAPPGSLPPVGYGVYAEPVADTLRQFGVCTQAHYHLGLEGLRAELAAGRPVIVWATYDLRESETYYYTASDGATAYAIPYQHVFIAVGYDSEGVQLIDAYNGALKHFGFEAFETAWSRFEQMAVTICDGKTLAATHLD